MVKLKGPGMAQDASGSLAETLTFSNWKGLPYLKLHQKPKQPNTAKQVAIRAIVNFLSTIWNDLPIADKATWTALAAAQNISKLNTCVGFNLTRWRGFHYPATKLPATEIGATQNWRTWMPVGHIRHISHLLADDIPNDGRGWALHRGTSAGFTRAWTNLAHIVAYLPRQTSYIWIDRLPAGTYWYKGLGIASDGRASTQLDRGPLIVTA